MNDVYLFLIPLSVLAVVFVAMWTVDKVTQDCWHSWDNWTQQSLIGVFIQTRQCKKCGYVEMEQTKSMKDLKDYE
jgi:hypothetical protein